jgi:hypothetical protein
MDTIYLYVSYNICRPTSGHKESFYAHFHWCIARVLCVNYSLRLTAFVLSLNSFPAIRVLARIFYAYFSLVKKKNI